MNDGLSGIFSVMILFQHMSHILMLNITMIYLFLRINICLKFLSAACVTVLYAVFVSSFPNKFYEVSIYISMSPVITFNFRTAKL